MSEDLRPDPASPSAVPTRRLFVAGALGAVGAACTPGGPVELPALVLPGLPGLTLNGWPVPGLHERQFLGRVSLLNVWASWCGYCRGEHETLMRLSSDGRFAMVGLVHQDRPERAVAYLRRSGNPYRAVAADTGGFARVLGQRGVPATYVVDRRGRVVERVRGAIGDDAVRARIMPAILQALAA